MEQKTPLKGIRILRRPRGTSSTSGGLLETLRRIVQRKKSKQNPGITPPAATNSAHSSGSPSSNQGSSTTLHGSSTVDEAQTHRLSQMVARLSIPTGHTDTEQLPQVLDENNGEEHSNAEDDEDDDNPDEKVYNGTITKPKHKGKQRRKWVKKLLNQSATPQIHKDRVYKTTRKHPHYVHHCRHHRGPLPPPQMLTVANALHVHCVAHILGFLDASEPASTCAYVNKAVAASVRVFYETYCSHPRPQRFLVQKLFQNDSIVRDILGWLNPVERVRVNASCQSFYHAANALPLEITGSQSAAQFAHYLAKERVETRFEATKELHLENMHADEAMTVVRFLDTDDESECFQALTTLSLRRIRGFEDDQQSFEQFIQVLFTDRVSRRLHTLELSDLGLEDSHYKYLATLFYDAQFPSLRCLNLSRNQFSSRFMRDWHRSFVNERFEKLQALDITDVSMSDEDTQRFVMCLAHLPALQCLRISSNFFSFEALTLLSEQIATGKLRELRELTCNVITTDSDAMGNFLEAFHGRNGTNAACPKLEQLSISGNSIANTRTWFKVAQVVAKQRWKTLTCLDISNMDLGEEGFHEFTQTILQNQSLSLENLRHLDVSGNHIARAIRELSECLLPNAFPNLRFLSLAGNAPGGEGVARFCALLRSPAAQSLHCLDLSQNGIAYRSLMLIAETLVASAQCSQLHQLNLSRNLELRSVVKYQETYIEGCAFVKDTLARMSVEELRRRKQALFESRLTALQLRNDEKARRDVARCKRQCQLLRAQYDHMESEADRALRRRKRIRKSTHLCIHQEIQQLKQAHQHRAICKALQASQ